MPQTNVVNFPRRVRPRGMPLGAVNPALSDAAVGAGVGAKVGSVVPGVGTAIGTAVGAAVGAVAGLLAAKPNTAAHLPWAGQLTNAISRLPSSANGIGRQIPWNEDSHGLTQFIEALLATGVYMGWDGSMLSNYDVCAHWAMTFAAAVKQVVTAIANNPVGASVAVPVTDKPGGNDARPGTFNFINPGLNVGPDAISANIIMGPNGLMAWMIWRTGESAQHMAANASNALAQKVFGLMVDNVAASVAPAQATPVTPPPNVAPVVPAASAAAKTAVANPPAISQPQPVAQQPAPQPISQPQPVNTLTPSPVIQQQQQPIIAPQPGPPQVIYVQGPSGSVPVDSSTGMMIPQSSGFSLTPTTMLLIGGVVVAVYFITRKKK